MFLSCVLFHTLKFILNFLNWVTLDTSTSTPQFEEIFLFKTGGGANGLELLRSLCLEAGSVRQRRRAKLGRQQPLATP